MIPAGDFITGRNVGSLLSTHQFDLGLTSRARGGLTIGVAAGGLDLMDWIGRVDAGQFKIQGPGAELTVVAVPGALSATFAFDRNMNPAICWNTVAGAKFYWFDTVAGEYKTTDYPLAQNAMVIHDDVRDLAESRSDVVLFYQHAGSIYYRQQRERYLTEHLARAGASGNIIRVGMGTADRLLIRTR